ncbi:MAG: nitrogenase component 1 [Lachnospiraceae bacterium]|nr:nitrogenase component 1 [Lachnospiraceae bacterium]
MKFEGNLCYCSPAHGGWGIIRVAAMIPESYLLFVCPAACFRHGALGAIQHGYKNRISYLYISQEDIVEGYDALIEEGIDELLKRTKEHIRLLFVYVSCLDDFIGTDLDAVLEKAGRKYPEVVFRPGHMNPIASSTKLPPAVTTFDSMLAALPVHEKTDENVSLYGNFVGIPEDNELIKVLNNAGKKVRQISNCGSFDEYREMSLSEYGIILKPLAAMGVSNLEKKTGAVHVTMYASYDIDTVKNDYSGIEKMLGISIIPEIGSAEEAARSAIEKAKEAVGDLPVYVSDSATIFPCRLALTLLRYGFNVKRIYAVDLVNPDQDAIKALQENYPEVEIIQADHPKMNIREKNESYALSIGEEAAYLSNSRFVADISADEGMLGFQGIKILMDTLAESVKEKADIRKLIEEYGGIV